MAEGGQDQDDKTEEPTPKRLEDARKRGDIVYSAEAGAFLALLGGYVLLTAGAGVFADIGHWLSAFFALPHALPADAQGLQRLGGALTLRLVLVIAFMGAVLAVAALLSRYLQDKATFSAQKLQPKLENLDPLKGFKRVFGAQAIANLLKGLAKLTVVGGAVAWAAWPRDAAFETLPLLDVAAIWPLAQARSAQMVLACLVAFAVLAGADYLWTRHTYRKRLRMSRRDIKDELKQTEGDPQVRARLRGLRMQKARQRMMQQVPTATVVITNPTHYAVALRYVPGETAAPLCVAKGLDEVALRIRAIAEEAGVALVEDPPLARALYATAEIDAQIPREHFEAVAKVIGFVLRLDQRRRSGRGTNRP